jgi:hypothetical protein
MSAGFTTWYSDPYYLYQWFDDGMDCYSFGYVTENSGPVEVVPEVKIKRNGQVVNNTTQTVTIGEKVELTTEVTGGTVTGREWTVPGKTVSNYNIVCSGPPLLGATRCTGATSAAPATLSQLNGASVTYYWWEAGNSLQVTHNVIIGGRSYPATVTFNVLSPTGSIAGVQQNLGVRGPIYTEIQDGGNWYLAHGEIDFDKGIKLRPTINYQSGVTQGNIQWVQVYKISRRLQNTDNSWVKVSREGIDRTYPYPFNPTNSNDMDDSPRQQLTGVVQNGNTFNWKRVEVNDTAKTWLMFKPDTMGSIWVPLAFINWGWSGVATKSGSGWVKDSSSTSGPTNGSPLAFPIWDNNVNDASYENE